MPWTLKPVNMPAGWSALTPVVKFTADIELLSSVTNTKCFVAFGRRKSEYDAYLLIASDGPLVLSTYWLTRRKRVLLPHAGFEPPSGPGTQIAFVGVVRAIMMTW